MIEPAAKPVPTADRTVAGKTVGTVHADAPTIYIYEGVLAQLIDYCARDLTRERGGFLVGGLHVDRGTYVEVRGFVPAAETESGAVSITFTHDTWAAMTRQIDEHYPDEVVLGWVHTHPRLGVFLSGHDLFIHRHFFSQPWQIAMVVDPQRRQLGLFQWRGGEVVSCGFVCVRMSAR